MDGQRFDAWSRALANRLSRRRTVKALVGAGAAGVATRTVVQEAEACLEDGQYCTDNRECCGVCISFNCTDCVGKGHGTCEGPNDCCGGKMDCVNGKCTKKQQDVKCDGKNCKKGKKGKGKKKHNDDTSACSVGGEC